MKRRDRIRIESFNFRFLGELFIACVFALIFALFCSGRVGYFIIYFLILMPLLSIISSLLAARFISLEPVSGNDVYEKGTVFDIVYRLDSKKRFLMLPEIEIAERVTGSVAPEGTLRVRRREGRTEFVRKYRAVYAGGAVVEPQRLVLRDFTGLLSFSVPVRLLEDSEESIEIGVLPRIRQIPADSPLIERAVQGADMFGDSEETLDETSRSFGGFPGYDHREYADGDPIKRINYKLSARRDALFVRLDEKQVYGSVEIFIDPEVPAGITGDMCPPWWEEYIEESISLCENLLSRQFNVSLSYVIGSRRVTQLLKKEGDGAALLGEIAYCRYREEVEST